MSKRRKLKSKSGAAQHRSVRSTAYENLDAASAGMGIPRLHLETAKAMNAPGFRASRIYPDEFLPWFEAHKTEALAAAAKLESKDEADARVARARANRMEFELEVRRRQFIPTHEVSQVFTRACVAIKSKMLAIPSSLAPRLAIMSSPDDIATILKTSMVDALTELSKTKWNKSK